MANNPLLTVSRKGILRGIAEKADRKLAYYMTSDASQSILYKGSVRSLQSTVQQKGGDRLALEEAVQKDMEALYSGLYDEVTANISVKEQAWDGSQRFDIQIDVIITQDGVRYSLGRLIQSINGVVQPLIDQTNG